MAKAKPAVAVAVGPLDGWTAALNTKIFLINGYSPSSPPRDLPFISQMGVVAARDLVSLVRTFRGWFEYRREGPFKVYGATLGILVRLHVDDLMRCKPLLAATIFEYSKHLGQYDFPFEGFRSSYNSWLSPSSPNAHHQPCPADDLASPASRNFGR